MRDMICEVTTLTTADGETVVSAESGVKFYGCVLRDDGTNDATVVIKDGSTQKVKFLLKASQRDCEEFNLPVPIKMTTNLTVQVTGTNAESDIFFGR